MRTSLLQKSWSILKTALRYLAAADPFRMAGATAFFTIFALPPIVMIIVRILGVFIDKRTVGRSIFDPLSGIFGKDSTDSMLQTIRSFRALQHNYLVTAGIFIFLLFVATTLFKVIRNSINQIWSMRGKPGASIGANLISRVYSVGVILAGGLLFLAVQLVDAGEQVLTGFLDRVFQHDTLYVGAALRVAVVALFTSLWFYLLFMLLPDGRPPGRIAAGGAVVTGVLFTAGKALLGVLLRPVQVSNFYGISGAIALVLLFMFYSSLILYFGAALIRAWTEAQGHEVAPKRHAEYYRTESGQLAAVGT